MIPCACVHAANAAGLSCPTWKIGAYCVQLDTTVPMQLHAPPGCAVVACNAVASCCDCCDNCNGQLSQGRFTRWNGNDPPTVITFNLKCCCGAHATSNGSGYNIVKAYYPQSGWNGCWTSARFFTLTNGHMFEEVWIDSTPSPGDPNVVNDSRFCNGARVVSTANLGQVPSCPVGVPSELLTGTGGTCAPCGISAVGTSSVDCITTAGGFFSNCIDCQGNGQTIEAEWNFITTADSGNCPNCGPTGQRAGQSLLLPGAGGSVSLGCGACGDKGL
jgi:hypothetical protein